MLWYNNPDAVKSIHDQAMEERYEDRRRHGLRLADGGDPTQRT